MSAPHPIADMPTRIVPDKSGIHNMKEYIDRYIDIVTVTRNSYHRKNELNNKNSVLHSGVLPVEDCNGTVC
jgi:hypothetical protein